jgi:hypothetical protein
VTKTGRRVVESKASAFYFTSPVAVRNARSHTRARTHMHVSTQTRTRMHTHMHAHTNVHTHAHTCTHEHTHRRTQTRFIQRAGCNRRHCAIAGRADGLGSDVV